MSALLGFLLIVSRAPLMPPQLFSEDEVNFAYALENLDTRIGQPQPPGYPVFVLEMRMLHGLGVQRPEHVLQILAFLASATAIALTVGVGNAVVGGASGWWGAFALLFYPAFWYAGITSAVRVHLAVVSLAVAGSCWLLATTGRRTWLYLGALSLGIGSGIRPELGPLLLPLWLWSVFRGERTWRHRSLAGALLFGLVLSWFLWISYASGGVSTYVRTTWLYLTDHVALSPTLEGSATQERIAISSRFLVWLGVLLPGLILPATLLARRREAIGLASTHVWFFLLWMLPPLLFAGWVHLADPGHGLAIVPIVAITGGALIDRGARLWGIEHPWRQALALALLAAGLAYAVLGTDIATLVAIPIVGAIAGWILPLRRYPQPASNDIWPLGLVLLAPSLCLNAAVFLQQRWPVPQPPLGIVAQINLQASSVNMSSIQSVNQPNLRAIEQAQEWIAASPRDASVLWFDNPTHWRKVAFYMQTVPITVVQRTTPFPDAPWIVEIARGPRTRIHRTGETIPAIQAMAGRRLVWMVSPGSRMPALLKRELGAACTIEGVCATDLPDTHGSRRIGAISLEW